MIDGLADLAGIPSDRRRGFKRNIDEALEYVREERPRRTSKLPRQGNTLPHLKRLRLALQKLLPGERGFVAGGFLNVAIQPLSLEDWIESVERAEHMVARNPRTKLRGRGRERGTTAGGRFDTFVIKVVCAVHAGEGKLTCWRDRHGDPKGSFMQMLDAMDLPPRFVPRGRAPFDSFRRAHAAVVGTTKK